MIRNNKFDFSDDDFDEMDNEEDKTDMLWVGGLIIVGFLVGYYISKPVQSPVVIDNMVV